MERSLRKPNMKTKTLAEIRKELKAAEDVFDALRKEAKKFKKTAVPDELAKRLTEAEYLIETIKKQLRTKAFVFGALQPFGDLQPLNDQYYLAFQYKKALLKLEVEQRERYAAIETKYGGEELAKLKEDRKEINEQISTLKKQIAEYKKDHSSKTASPELRAAMKQLKRQSNQASENIAAFKKTMDSEAYAVEKADHKKWIEEGYKRIYNEFGQRDKCLGWGTRLVIADAVKATRKGKKPPSTFVDRTREVIAAQIQTDEKTRISMTLDQAFACTDNRFRLKPLPDSAFEKGAPRKSRYTVAQLKIGTQSNPRTGRRTNVPIMVEVPVYLHRTLPPEAMIKWVKLFRERDGGRYAWKLSLSVEYPRTFEEADISDILSVDLGWKQVDGGWRIAYWARLCGDKVIEHGDLVVPDRIVQKFLRADKLKSVIDENRDELKTWIMFWYEKQDKRKIPDIVRDELKNVHSWFSHNKFVVLTRIVSDNTFVNSDELLTVLSEWKKRYKHLLSYWKGEKRRAINARNYMYRVFSDTLRKKGNVLGLEDMSIKTFKESPQPESAKEESKTAKRQLQYAAPGTLRKYLTEKFDYVVWIDPAYTSQICPDCGNLLDYGDDRAFGTCTACGKVWDRDLAGSSNIASRTKEKIESVGIVEACKKPEKKESDKKGE